MIMSITSDAPQPWSVPRTRCAAPTAPASSSAPVPTTILATNAFVRSAEFTIPHSRPPVMLAACFFCSDSSVRLLSRVGGVPVPPGVRLPRGLHCRDHRPAVGHPEAEGQAALSRNMLTPGLRLLLNLVLFCTFVELLHTTYFYCIMRGTWLLHVWGCWWRDKC